MRACVRAPTGGEAKELTEKKAAAGLVVKPVQAIDALRKILVDIKKSNPGNDEGVATCFKTFLAYLVGDTFTLVVISWPLDRAFARSLEAQSRSYTCHRRRRGGERSFVKHPS